MKPDPAARPAPAPSASKDGRAPAKAQSHDVRKPGQAQTPHGGNPSQATAAHRRAPGEEGLGAARGAVTVLNATATGIGCALAINAPTTARWMWGGEEFEWLGATDDALARAVQHVVAQAAGLPADIGARADCSTPFAPSRGLKTSSAAATAMVRAAAAAAGIEVGADRLDGLAIDAARAAGVTITGAFDDQMAVSRGGCHISDNRAHRILASLEVAPWHVAVWVPEARIAKSAVATIDPAPARAGVTEAMRCAEAGDIPGAMTLNGEAFLELYAAAGLPVTRAPVDAAMAAGALGAGLSGTGPAVAALFEQRVPLQAAAGGEWRWHRVVP